LVVTFPAFWVFVDGKFSSRSHVADVTDSTKLYDTLGDDDANRIISKVLDLMEKLTEMYQGYKIKTIGDEIMCRFQSAGDCARTAIEIQEEIAEGIEGEDIAITVKVGIHFGPAIMAEDGDVFGDAVNVAARMAGIAKGMQIILTEDTVKLLPPDLQDACRIFDRTTVKGKAEEINVYQLVWESSDDVTRIEFTAAPEEKQVQFLSLFYKNQETKIQSDDHRTFVIGRGVQSDLLCQTKLASRKHAVIEFRRGKFHVLDQSSNGTFIRTDEGENISLRRQELPLWGSGFIGIGEEVALDDVSSVIRFHCG
jgi:class 3 adenylate cyclase